MNKKVRTLTNNSIAHLKEQNAIAGMISVIDNIDGPIEMPEEERNALLNSPVKWLSTMNIIVCIQGYLEYTLGYQKGTVRAGEILFMKAGLVCEMRNVSDDAAFFSILLNEDKFIPSINDLSLNLLLKTWANNPVAKISESEISECMSIYSLVKNHLINPDNNPFLLEIVKGYIQSLIYIVFSCFYLQEKDADDKKVKKSKKEELCESFLDLLEEKYLEERNIKYYAEELNVTPRYLSKIVQEQTGLLASEHIQNHIISKAKQFLIADMYSIQQIAEKLGFANQSLFGRYFKQNTGFSPNKFREDNIK